MIEINYIWLDCNNPYIFVSVQMKTNLETFCKVKAIFTSCIFCARNHQVIAYRICSKRHSPAYKQLLVWERQEYAGVWPGGSQIWGRSKPVHGKAGISWGWGASSRHHHRSKPRSEEGRLSRVRLELGLLGKYSEAEDWKAHTVKAFYTHLRQSWAHELICSNLCHWWGELCFAAVDAMWRMEWSGNVGNCLERNGGAQR